MTVFDYTYYSNVLVHSGTKGMKWGQRRYQNPDGSLTPAGRERYNKGSKTSMVAKVKTAASQFKKDVKKTGKEVKKAIDKQKVKKIKAEQDKAKAEREAWFDDKKSMMKHFGEMTTAERERALKSLDQFDRMEKYRANSTGRNLDLIKKGVEIATGGKGFDDLMKGATTLYNLSKTVNKDQKEKKEQIENAAKQAKEAAIAEKKSKKEAAKAEKEARKEAIKEQQAAEKELVDRKERANRVMDVIFKPKNNDGKLDDRNFSDLVNYYKENGIDKNTINKTIATSKKLSDANVVLGDILSDMKRSAAPSSASDDKGKTGVRGKKWGSRSKKKK